jgi:hypothetical protein
MAITVRSAAPLVAKLGFLVRWDLPTDTHGALLVIALRDRPTLRHYDPELVSFWHVGDDGRGHRADLSLATTMPVERPISWGPIEIVDRLHVTNTFISFGGTLTAERIDPTTAVVTIQSSGPILPRGGHSQPYDQLAAEMAAFFARLLVPIDFEPGAEARIGATPPDVLYAAFLRHEVARLAESELVREAYGPDARLVRAEAERLGRRSPDAWRAGGELLASLRLLEDVSAGA